MDIVPESGVGQSDAALWLNIVNGGGVKRIYRCCRDVPAGVETGGYGINSRHNGSILNYATKVERFFNTTKCFLEKVLGFGIWDWGFGIWDWDLGIGIGEAVETH